MKFWNIYPLLMFLLKTQKKKFFSRLFLCDSPPKARTINTKNWSTTTTDISRIKIDDFCPRFFVLAFSKWLCWFYWYILCVECRLCFDACNTNHMYMWVWMIKSNTRMTKEAAREQLVRRNAHKDVPPHKNIQ